MGRLLQFEYELSIGDSKPVIEISHVQGGGSMHSYHLSLKSHRGAQSMSHIGEVIFQNGKWQFHLNADSIIDAHVLDLLTGIMNWPDDDYSWGISIRDLRGLGPRKK